MAVTTTQEFLAICRKSKLFDDEQLAETENWTEQTDDPKRMAATLAKREWVTRWQAHQLLNGRSSFSMGKYNLIELLGRRGMGNVFLAQHATMKRLVALKIVSKKIGRDPQLLKRFLDEARAIATLDHDNIVRAYSVDKEGDCYYIVMEYVEGKNLEDIVKQDGPLDSVTAAAFIRQAAAGLAHAHDKDLIHGDVRPSCLVVDNDGDLKILDVGISEFTFGGKDESGEQKELEPKAVNYLAPELCGGDPKPDPRSDLYSLGCTLYFLLTGKPPFPSGNALQRMEQHRNDEPESILKTRPDVSKNLAKVCRKMMAKDPADRFRSASVVQRVLAEIVQMEQANGAKSPEQAAPPPPRDSSPPAGKGNGQPSPEKKTPAAGKPRAAAAGKPKAAAATAGAPAAGSTKPAAAPKKKSGGPDFNFLDAPAGGAASEVPAIQVGKKRKKKAAPAAATAAAAPAAAKATPTAKKTPAAKKTAPAPAAEAPTPAPVAEAKPAGKGGKMKWVIIGGVAALALLFLGVAVPGAMWALGFFGGDEEQVAEEQPDQTDAAATRDDDEGVSRDDEGGIAGRDDEGGIAGRDDEGGIAGRDDEGGIAGTADEPDSGDDGDDTAVASADGVAPDDGMDTDGADADAADTTGDGSNEPPGDDSGTEPPAAGTDDTATPDEAAAGDDTAEKPEPEDNPPEEKPAPPDKPKDPPKPPPKPKDPFRNFKPTMNLLAADDDGGAGPQPLAAVDVAADAIWFVSLVGGDDVGKGKRLKINSNGEDGHKARWTMDLESPAVGRREATTAQVGNIWYENGNLVFQWNKEGGNVPDGVLQSCLIQIDVESESRTLGFFEPKMAEPLVLTMNKKVTIAKVELDKVPNADKLKFEVTRLEGIKDKMALEPNGPVPVKTPVNVQIMRTDAFNNVVPGVVFQATLGATTKNLTVSHRLSGSVGDVAAQQGLRFPLPPDGRNMVEGKIKELEGMMKGKHGQGLRGDERTKVEQGIRFGGMALWFDDFVKNPAGPAKMHYRIFMDIGGRQVDVVRTEAPKPPAPKKGGGKKA